MATVDKDFDQVPGWHFNFIKKLHYHISEADATRFFYKQLLTGDATDNIFGLDRVGPKTAEKMLKDCTNEEEMYAVCAEAYDDYPRLLENARLLWLRRKRKQMWEPPL
jgi:5'-3' exonuclease